ncbi:hypothetical protein [Chryseobacterium rhizosphaerae]|uniref:hypothetical protein n=1 Tax=Chryseobacterium rhizosphaerae TaxID=395937 RepID=UPI0023582544|nr:hypothetical protein [Chryseobacterium rhizosphaerae]MDC8098921.1 hypothetical protein [Chryseobacterium rhizosphaerae]
MQRFFLLLLFGLQATFFCAQNYVKTNLWQDTTLMDDSKVDGIIYIKKNNDFFVDNNFLVTKSIKIDDFKEKDDASKFEKAIQVLKKLNGGTLVINNNLTFNRKIIINNLRGIEIVGNKASYSLQGGLFTGSTIIFQNNSSLVISDFIDLKIKNVNFFNTEKNHKQMLELYKGYDFEIDNVKIRSANSFQSIALSLGKYDGENAVFQGKISRLNVIDNDGGIGVFTGDSNTSLTFENCYLQGCSFNIEGTIYSSIISCAVDGSPNNGYNLKKGPKSNTHSITFISSGAESANKSGWYIDSGSYLIEIISPHSGHNNVGKYRNIGALMTIDNTNPTYDVSNIKISSPSSFNNSKNWDIYIASPKVGEVILSNIYKKAFSYGIGYHQDWDKANLKVF